MSLSKRILDGQYLECQKCKHTDGGDWSQCNGKCPVKSSPYFDQETKEKFGAVLLKG